MMKELTRRLNAAIEASGLNHELLAERVGIEPAALRRILDGNEQRLDVAVLAELAHSVHTTVGHLLGETDFAYSTAEAKEFRRVLDEAAQLLDVAHPDRATPAGARDLPDYEIPPAFHARGARHAVEVTDDSMTGEGIEARDILFIRPEPHAEEARDKIVLCHIDGRQCVKRLELSENADDFELIGIVIGQMRERG